MSLSDETRTELREALANATPGPWDWVPGFGTTAFYGGNPGCGDFIATKVDVHDVRLIVQAVNNLAALLDEIDQLRAENAELEAHAEYMGRMLPDVRQNIDDWKAAAETNRAAVDRVRALADQIEREATAPTDYRGIRRAHVARIRAALEGAEQ